MSLVKTGSLHAKLTDQSTEEPLLFLPETATQLVLIDKDTTLYNAFSDIEVEVINIMKVFQAGLEKTGDLTGNLATKNFYTKKFNMASDGILIKGWFADESMNT